MNDAHRHTAPTPATPSQKMLRGFILIALLLGSRLLMARHPVPVHGDEVGFVHGLGFPSPYPVHHPGYPLWVALGTLSWKFGLERYAALEFWSVLGSLAGPFLMYRGLCWIIEDGLAWWMALAFGVSPMIWFLSVTALNYTTALCLGLAVVGLCYRAIFLNEGHAARRAAWVMAVCIWLRPDYAVWLGPMLVWAAWKHRRAGGMTALLAPVASMGALALAVRSLYSGSGETRLVDEQISYWIEVLFRTNAIRLGFMDGFVRSSAKLGGIMAWALGPAALLLVPAIWRLARTARTHFAFLLVWVLPLMLFVLCVHMSEPGHVILLVPAAYWVISIWLQQWRSQSAAARLASALAILTAIQFLGYPWSTESVGWRRTLNAKVAYLSASGLRQIDRRWEIHTPSDVWPTEIHQPTVTRPIME